MPTRCPAASSPGCISPGRWLRALLLLVADEPTAALDPRHQVGICALIRGFVDGGGGALLVLHDVTLAARFADRLIWMRDGEIVASGAPAETLNERMMEHVYRVRTIVRRDEHGFDVRIEEAL